MAEGGPPDVELQKNEIRQLIKEPLKKGDIWYLVDAKWFKQWKKYVGFDAWDTVNTGEQTAYPGPIDNSPLLKESGALKEHLVDELDYVLVPEEGWEKMSSWYPPVEGQKPIARKVIEQGMFVKHCKVEVYLMDLKLCKNEDIDHCTSKQFSRADTIDDIEKEMRRIFSITDDKEVRLWNKYMSNTYEHLNKPDNTVQDAGLYSGQVIVVEQQNEDGTWPRQTKSTSAYNSGSASTATTSTQIESGPSSTATSSTSRSIYNSSGSSSSYSNHGYGSYYSNRGSASPGLCGLSNLGNTCFMNSALQCMHNVPPLVEYFLADRWKDELNLDNPLGMKGEIAKTFASLIHDVWSGKYSYVIPRDFKIAVGRFAPQFSGYQQQDSQELMAFLLDGLHEDLNRVKKKPYVEVKDANGRPDHEVAKEAWDSYKLRNDSVIVDTFHGLLKSRLICPECDKHSVTFDPFCYLSLPLPYKKERQIEVFLVAQDPAKKLVQYKLTVPKQGSVADLCNALSKHTNIPSEKMVVTDVYNHRFHKVFSHDEGLNHILDRDDIFIYEVPISSHDDPETVIIPVYLREKRKGYHAALFGQPLLVAVPRKTCSYDVLYTSVLQKMSRYVKEPAEDEIWWTEEKEMNGEGSDMETSSVDSDSMQDNKETEEDGQQEEEQPEGEGQPLEEEPKEKKHRMFEFHLVNSYGSSEIGALKDDGKPIKFSNRSYLAVDWHPKAKEKFYDERAAEDIDVHPTVNQRAAKQQKQPIQLSECLDLFTTDEKLGEHDLWYCPDCKKHQQATKKFDLWSLPDYLIIHLKRFSYNRYWRDKLDTFVEYPTKGLNMKNFVINKSAGPLLYDLIAVSNHYGGMGGGHYTAYCKNKELEEWHYFDDSSVSQTTEDAAVTKAGYVLVYQRRSAVINDKQKADIPAALGMSPDSDGNVDIMADSSEYSESNGASNHNDDDDDMEVSN
ncbi:ubiquitin carboxyl-terminal hydrolase 15 isoform X3 [Lingula anatina]|uniref:Ubiquitin carboxyl-terminal hydrolase n=1 Tax=Lingula anatina TaxID=7574 RepID=A0A1S3JR33_LINAN|nr:ubiquitin carboxyl-terminal hydrolase 15 isoform X2 [Lingula anatina]XP_013412556.1 ubiquitin carboxyl-terminal hydrolase 15 isoform X3 [Lingula anatina]|eukprot:XP_013412555.1 ubiquitin carboxyl-terminal hydrolase 15 isoform X2 [Lingula anatina]